MNYSDTIAAIATGGSISAIGIVRISGANALTAADSIFRAAGGATLLEAQDRKMYYGELCDAQGGLIDMCLCTVSRGPKSYTGEDTAEFHCHGSPVVLSQVLQALFNQGVRQAAAGEFTKRAFLNGRMDLTQAEAVIDLIEAETALAAKNAAGQLKGAVFTKMEAIYSRLLDITAHFHAVIDYPDEDIDGFSLAGYLETLRTGEEELRRLLSTHERGKVLTAGIPTAIAGRTNTGKSTLLNALLGYERAIVTDIPGTTRDTVEEKVLIGGVLLRLIDTAGLRDTGDDIEKLGIDRTKAALEGAGLVLLVLDGSQPLQDDDYKVIDTVGAIAPETPKIYICNKSDLPAPAGGISSGIAGASPAGGISSGIICNKSDLPAPAGDVVTCVSLSALTGEGLSQLEEAVRKIFPGFTDIPAGGIITSARQAQAIGRAADSLGQAQAALAANTGPDAVLTDIEAALAAIGEVTGKTIREDIVSRIFERFCVGK